MTTTDRVRRAVVHQFHNPAGPGGHLVGWIMSHRNSNVVRNRWAVGLFDVEVDDRVLELGCGPGVAVAELARRATQGVVVGVDHSSVMISQARRRNAAAVASGRVRLLHTSIEDLLPIFDAERGRPEPAPAFDLPFDVVLAVNNVGFWPEPKLRLVEIRRVLRPAGRIALVSQPRCRGASVTTSRSAEIELADLLQHAGFTGLESSMLDLDPPVVCVQASNPDTVSVPRPTP